MSSSTKAKDHSEALELVEFVPGKKASVKTLRNLLPDIDTTLFFAKAYKMDYDQLTSLLLKVHDTPVVRALTSGDHSTELQDYIVSTVPEKVLEGTTVDYTVQPPQSEILAQLWANVEVTLAESILQVADKIGDVLDSLPSKAGQMTFTSMAKLNRQRPTVGTYEASIKHQRQSKVLVILDVSGSMSEETIKTIADDVVALSYNANATLAIVSNETTVWAPGTYDTAAVLQHAEYGGTYYETLAPILNEEWGTVVTIADYDSSYGAKQSLSRCKGHIGKVVDVSLVNRPTFLAECVGQLADEVEPILVAQNRSLTR